MWRCTLKPWGGDFSFLKETNQVDPTLRETKNRSEVPKLVYRQHSSQFYKKNWKSSRKVSKHRYWPKTKENTNFSPKSALCNSLMGLESAFFAQDSWSKYLAQIFLSPSHLIPVTCRKERKTTIIQKFEKIGFNTINRNWLKIVIENPEIFWNFSHPRTLYLH